MTFDDLLVLSPDVMIIPVRELPLLVREEVGNPRAFALTRARARTPSTLVDEPMAQLLGEFRSPITIVEAIIRYSRRLGLNPEATLDDSYPALRSCLVEGYLVTAGSEQSERHAPRLSMGQTIGWTSQPGAGPGGGGAGAVIRCVHVLEDTELYQLALDDGGLAALKLVRPSASPHVEEALRHEADILDRLEGRVAPRLFATGQEGDNPWLAMEWCAGMLASTAAAGFRRTAGGDGALLDLCGRVAAAYGQLHDAGVVHGDVHPGNVLVSSAGVVRVVDFAFARVLDGDRFMEPSVRRGGVPAYFDPEYAIRTRSGEAPPPATPRSEQYSVAALLYELFTGAPYVDFSIDTTEMLRQIAEDDPLPFTRRARRPWPAVEDVLRHALAKRPTGRLSSTAELARRLAEIAPPSALGRPEAAARRHPGVEVILAAVLKKARPGGEWFEQGLPSPPYCSIVYGAAGLAVALCRLGTLRGDPEMMALADEWVVRAAREAHRPEAFTSDAIDVTEEIVGPISPFHRLSGIHAVQALVSHALGDPRSRQQAIDAFVVESRLPCDALDVTLGRAGTLLAAAILYEAVGGARYADLGGLVLLGHETLAGLWAALDPMPPVAEAAGMTYLGVAHGWAGVLLATLRWCRATATPRPPGLVGRLEQLAALAQPAGVGVRWPWTNGQDRGGATSTMPGWCNGTAGHVHLWTVAHEMLGDDRWADLAEKAGWDVYATPNRIAQLCCGLAGQAYALLELYRHTGEQRWLTAAGEVAAAAPVAAGTASPDSFMPGSLHKGDVGIAVLAADLAEPEMAAMPFFGPGA